MALDHGLGVDQAEADAFGLGRHERIEDTCHHAWIDADAIVIDLDDDFGAAGSGADGQRAAGWHRIDGVDEDVGEHLRKPFRIDYHLWQSIREGQRGLDPPVAQPGVELAHHGANDRVDVGGHTPQLARPGPAR